MANICDFSMFVIGKKNDIEAFYNALTQEGNFWIGRGVNDTELNLEIYKNDNCNAEIDYCAEINGWCKWSVYSALIDNAISMRDNNTKWYFGDVDVNKLHFITLYEASKKWNLSIEIFSAEGGMCFQEHYIVNNGDVIADECVDWRDGWDISDYDSKEDFEEENDMTITDEEWENRYIEPEGGFGEWEFGLWIN